MNRIPKIILPFLIIYVFLSCGTNEKKETETNKRQTEVSEVSVENRKPTINVYIENSGSMDGFVNMGNSFTNTINDYLTDIDIRYSDDIKLHYANSEIIPLNISREEFYSLLDVKSFRQMGGNRGETHLSMLLDTIISATNDSIVSIFITDAIFSPGRGRDAEKYINNEYNSIKISFANYSKNKSASVIVYQLFSEFKGTYYNRHDKRFPNTNMVLPYYIWLIGNTDHLTEIVKYTFKNRQDGSDVNAFSMSAIQDIDYRIKPASGNFRLDRNNPKTTINKLKKDGGGCNRGMARFSVYADFSKLLIDNKYLSNENNYEISNPNYLLSIKEMINRNNKHTHQLDFKSKNVHKGTLTVKLKKHIPQWIEEANDSRGDKPYEYKTYGLKKQIDGVYEAYEGDYYTEIKININ